MNYINRLKTLQKRLASSSMDGILITGSINLEYVSGFSGTSGIGLVTENTALLLTDFRYIEAANNQAPYFTVIDQAFLPEASLARQLAELEIKTLGIDTETLTYGFHQRLIDHLPTLQVINDDKIIQFMRSIKEPAEIEAIKSAAQISDQALQHVLPMIKPGMREQDLAVELMYYVNKCGAEMHPRFIVASGYRAALPHGYASNKIIETGDLLMIDFGASYQGYFSDITRTFSIGTPSHLQRQIYEIVRESQQKAIDETHEGKPYNSVFKKSANIIEEAGYSLGHGLGHGLGLEIHEHPFIRNETEGIFSENMAFTLEPGIYVSGWGGVRIEDTVITHDGACIPLTSFTKDLISI